MKIAKTLGISLFLHPFILYAGTNKCPEANREMCGHPLRGTSSQWDVYFPGKGADGKDFHCLYTCNFVFGEMWTIRFKSGPLNGMYIPNQRNIAKRSFLQMLLRP